MTSRSANWQSSSGASLLCALLAVSTVCSSASSSSAAQASADSAVASCLLRPLSALRASAAVAGNDFLQCLLKSQLGQLLLKTPSRTGMGASCRRNVRCSWEIAFCCPMAQDAGQASSQPPQAGQERSLQSA